MSDDSNVIDISAARARNPEADDPEAFVTNYAHLMPAMFPWYIEADADTVRELAGQLLTPRADFMAGGSSFAVTAIPRWRLWLSEASDKRVRELLSREDYLKLIRSSEDD